MALDIAVNNGLAALAPPPLIMGGGQMQIDPGTLPARWYTLFGISDQAAGQMNLKPTAEQLQLFQQMKADPTYASIFQQSASTQNIGWEYTDAQKQLVQQAAMSFVNGQIQQTPQQVVAAAAANDPFNNANAQKMFALEGKGFSGQDAQSAVLGTNQYQTGVIGAGGGSTGGGNYQDVSPGVYTAAPTWTPGMSYEQFDAAFAKWEAATRSAADQYGAKLAAGIQNYYASIGENSQGISQAQISANDRTYGSIQDPTQQIEWLSAQDPGNLSAGLRAKWTQLVLPGIQAGAAQNQSHEFMSGTMLHDQFPSQVGGEVSGIKGGFDVTYGSVVQQDAATGRVTEFNNVPTGATYQAPDIGSFGCSMDRLGGGIEGGLQGFMSGMVMGGGFGAIAGTVLGAAQGSGALGGMNGKGLGTWKWGQPQQAGGIEAVGQLGVSMAFAEFAPAGGGLMNHLGRAGLGSAIGSINGILTGSGNFQQRTLKGGMQGGIMGGMASNGGRSFYGPM